MAPVDSSQLRCSMRRSTSPGSACRPSFDFWKTGVPSTDTSNRPPPEGISSISASGYVLWSSAANLVARGS